MIDVSLRFDYMARNLTFAPTKIHGLSSCDFPFRHEQNLPMKTWRINYRSFLLLIYFSERRGDRLHPSVHRGVRNPRIKNPLTKSRKGSRIPLTYICGAARQARMWALGLLDPAWCLCRNGSSIKTTKLSITIYQSLSFCLFSSLLGALGRGGGSCTAGQGVTSKKQAFWKKSHPDPPIEKPTSPLPRSF